MCTLPCSIHINNIHKVQINVNKEICVFKVLTFKDINILDMHSRF